MRSIIKIGTRGSKLALWQANRVKSDIEKTHPEIKVRLEIIKTKGDKILDAPLAKIGGKGLFVKEIENALLEKRIDIAVHSMKDMPALIPAGLCIGAVPDRENPLDVLISKNNLPFKELPKGARIGTGSLRRGAQLLHARPDIKIIPIRGNLDTRLKKLESENMDAIILAAAGVKRLSLTSKITEYLDPETMLPAAGQGALCIEIRDGDKEISNIVSDLDHRETRRIVFGERAFLDRLGGSCQVPIGALGKVIDNKFTLKGLIAEIDGSNIIKKTKTGSINDSKEIGKKLATDLFSMGGDKMLARLKQAAEENL